MKRKYCYVYLTCAKGDEESLARTLLEKHLVACAKFTPVNSMYWWHSKVEQDNEMLITFETADDLFTEIEAEVTKVHRYDTFVLTCVAIDHINDEAAEWLEENIKEASWTKKQDSEA